MRPTIVAALAIIAAAFPLSAHAGDPCGPKNACVPCDLATLHPTQMSVGVIEVKSVDDKITGLSPDKRAAFPFKHPATVYVSPSGQMFIVDGHHHARAMLDSGMAKSGQCHIARPQQQETEAAFEAVMTDPANPHTRLRDANGSAVAPDGHTYTFADLPPSLATLQDDPYRTLAELVLKKCNPAGAEGDFAQFKWADYLRAQAPKLRDTINGDRQNDAIAEADHILASAGAAGLPNYPAKWTCHPA